MRELLTGRLFTIFSGTVVAFWGAPFVTGGANLPFASGGNGSLPGSRPGVDEVPGTGGFVDEVLGSGEKLF